MKLWQRFESQLEEARRAIPGGPQGWRPERLIFRDWWHWKDQEFGFAHGRLALTGQNAGGKSSVLALTIPMLLDGRTEPTRLDPAQSRDRFLHYYLLGPTDADRNNPEAFHYEARTGYVALEFYHVTQQRYLTIGMGVFARSSPQHKIADWWGFLLLQNQRLGRTFEVRGMDGACLSRRDFARAVGQGGVVVTERAEYQRLVNQHLFGMEDDDYHALIEMLLQARRPKLGEQSGPDKVCDMLSNALPGIPTDRLARVGDVINNIEEYRRNQRDVQAKAEAVDRLDQRLLALAEALVQEAAQHYQEAQSKHGSLASRLRAARASHAEAEEELAKLAARAGERTVEVSRAEAARNHLRPSAGNLQERLIVARAAQATQSRRVHDLEERVSAGNDHFSADQARLKKTDGEFHSRKRTLVTTMQATMRLVEPVAWTTGARAMAEAIRHTEVLDVTDPQEVVLDAGPGSGLGDQARTLAADFLKAAEVGAALDEATRQREQANAHVEALRGNVKAAAERTEAAKDQADARAEDLVGALTDWTEVAQVLEPPDEMLAQIASAIREQQEPVTSGHRTFIEQLTYLGERRRQDLACEQAELSRLLAAAQLRSARLAADRDALDKDPGDPSRSELRASARGALGNQALPLFRLVRFQPEVSGNIAARVEAALLEAGWLDLLTEPVAGADAYMIPAPYAGPTLARILTPEPGAPDVVGELLASIGWGEGEGDRWISPDGTWQNGPARGTVSPWAPFEAEFVGAEARERRKTRRLSAIIAEQKVANATLAQIEEKEALRKARQNDLEQELRRLDELPWQEWFTALNVVTAQQQAREEARTRLEAAKPLLLEAERTLTKAQRQFHEAVEGLPGSRGLSTSELRERCDGFRELAARLDGLLPLYRELGGLAQGHKDQTRALSVTRANLEALKADLAEAQRAFAVAETAVQTLEGQVRDPELQSRLAQLRTLEERLQTLAAAERADGQRQSELHNQLGGARSTIADLEPEEREWSEKRTIRLDKLKEQLRLHVALAAHADALEKAGPVSYLPKLLRLVEAENLQDEITARRNALIHQEHEERNLLAEYRPTAQGPNSLVFYEDRIPLPAHRLRERLELRTREYAGLLDEEQRRLFQDIIYEGILDELRRLIRQAREFTRRTTDKLRRPLSNGEVLSLRWSPVSAAMVPAARIGAALEQMEQGARFLPEDKRDVLLATIKEEVERVRSTATAQGRDLSYHEAVAEALDYRKWYAFEILSKMPGTTAPVPIRTKGFGKRSTSAKAWALAVPILAAVAARYDSSPQNDLPRLIGLDEAFAGFDTKNQENYVALLTDLGFSWIITIPDEVPYGEQLSAVMTYRMTLDGDFHTGFPILWNGQVAFDPMSGWQDEVAAGVQP